MTGTINTSISLSKIPAASNKITSGIAAFAAGAEIEAVVAFLALQIRPGPATLCIVAPELDQGHLRRLAIANSWGHKLVGWRDRNDIVGITCTSSANLREILTTISSSPSPA